MVTSNTPEEIETSISTLWAGINSLISRANILELVKLIRTQLIEMKDDDRLNLFRQIMEEYCEHCGCYDPYNKCQCWNDD